jgi:hypothetical protein
MSEQLHDTAPAAITVRAAEIAVALLIAIGAVVVMVSNYQIGAAGSRTARRPAIFRCASAR